MREVRSSRVVVLRQTARKAVRSGALWGYVFGIVVASSAISYTRIYKTQAERAHLAAAFGSNNADERRCSAPRRTSRRWPVSRC